MTTSGAEETRSLADREANIQTIVLNGANRSERHMDQDLLVEALGKHLAAIESLVNAVGILALGAAWAGVRRTREIEALGAKFDRRHAFWILAVMYLVANMALLILFLRVGDLFALLEPAHALKGATALATHAWVLNPFSYFGSSAIARFHACEGYGLLIATWWVCNTSLSTLMDDKSNRAARILLGAFLAIGLGCMLAINRASHVVLESLRGAAPTLYSAVLETAIERNVGNVLGIAIGSLFFASTNRLQKRWSEKTEARHPNPHAAS